MRNTKRAVGRGMGFMNRLTSHSAFTMAEILLSLTIIGVVAAITLPSLTGNINERTWATQKKALYARMSQAFPLMDSINTYDDAESFVAAALNSVTKINNVCGQANVTECGMDGSSIGTLKGGTIEGFSGSWYKWESLGIDALKAQGDIHDFMVSKSDGTTEKASTRGEEKLVAAFETGNGESIVIFYNPTCISDQEVSPDKDAAQDWVPYVCANLVYDLNNQKGPNTVGKDIGFMTVFYPTDSVVVNPIPDVTEVGVEEVKDGDTIKTPAASGTCATDEYRIPNKYEAMSLALNSVFIDGTKITGKTSAAKDGDTAAVATTAGTPKIVSSSKGANTNTTYVYKIEGKALIPRENSKGTTRCVKR